MYVCVLCSCVIRCNGRKLKLSVFGHIARKRYVYFYGDNILFSLSLAFMPFRVSLCAIVNIVYVIQKLYIRLVVCFGDGLLSHSHVECRRSSCKKNGQAVVSRFF